MTRTVEIDGATIEVADDDPRFPVPVQQPDRTPDVSGDAILGAIGKADRAKLDPFDIARIAYRDDVPASNAKLGRIAKAIGTTPDALRTAASVAS